MIEVRKIGVLLEKTNLGFECEGVLNPAVIADDSVVHLLYRAVGKGNYSTLGYCKLIGPLKVTERSDTPVLFPQHDYECQGIEDPRIVHIDHQYFLSYTAYDGVNALGALANTTDFKHFQKQGIIVPQMTYEEFFHLAESKEGMNGKYARYNEHKGLEEMHGKKLKMWDKNVIFFPRRIKGKLTFLHRVRPDIQLVMVDQMEDLTPEYWQNYFLHLHAMIVMRAKYDHEVSYIGGGCPPIETKEGWLLIYHGVYDTIDGYVYSACAALLDLEDPLIEIARLPYALFSPEEPWELKGAVNNVCFPTGTTVFDDTLYIYYGAADEQIAVASVNLSALIAELLTYSK